MGSGLIESLTDAMHYLSERQRVVARNIANSETPGFKARETVPPDFGALLAAQGNAVGPHVTRPVIRLTAGMAALGARQPDGGRIVDDHDTGETKPDGNNVVLEEQLMKMGRMQTDFAAVTNIYRKQMAMLRTAAGHGGS